jgi:hypothetical protein
MRHLPNLRAVFIAVGVLLAVVGTSRYADAQPTDIATLTRQAEAGNASAQVLLGLDYYSGEQVPQDYGLALKWFQKAAQQGDPMGQCRVGRMYEWGLGVSKDPSEALRWYHLSAEQGDSSCQFDLGEMYWYGNGVEPSDYEAVSWFRKAAAQGYAPGQYVLGGAYAEGRGVPQDYNKAASWYRKAAEQGHEAARKELDRLYEKGLVLPTIADLDASLMLSGGSKGIIPGEPLTCAQWPGYEPPQARSSTTFKLAYLLGLQYGHSAAVEDYFRWLRPKIIEDPDQTFNPQWRGLLFPAETNWPELIPEINAFCSEEKNRSELISHAAALVLRKHQPEYNNAGKPDDRWAFLNKFSCSSAMVGPWFFVGYRDSQRFFWAQLEAAGFVSTIPSWKNFMAGLEALQFQTPAGTNLCSALTDFCREEKNQSVSFVFAERAVALRLRGDEDGADSLLAPFYCKELPAIWVEGKQGKATNCLGIVVIVEAAPILRKPVAYIAGVINESDKIVEADWQNWSLQWTDRNGNAQTSAALDPQNIVRNLEKKANLASALAAFGAYMSASSPKTAAVYDSRGVSTIRVYPGPETASAASREAAKDVGEPKLALAQTLSDVAFRRTTIPPHSQTEGMLLFFDPPKGGEARLKLRIPGIAVFEIPVSVQGE